MSNQQHTDTKTFTHPTKGAVDYDEAAWTTPGGGDVAVNQTTRTEPDGTVETFYLLRHQGDPHGTVLLYDQGEWDAFVAGARDGEFDPATFEAEQHATEQS